MRQSPHSAAAPDFAQRDKLKARIAKLRPARKRAAPMAGEALTCLDVDQRAALPAREHGAMRLDAANSSLTDRSRSRKNGSSGESAETGSPPDYSIRRGRWTGIKRRNRFEPDGELTIAPLAFSNPDDDEGRH